MKYNSIFNIKNSGQISCLIGLKDKIKMADTNLQFIR